MIFLYTAIFILLGITLQLFHIQHVKKKVLKPIKVYLSEWRAQSRYQQNLEFEKLYSAYNNLDTKNLTISRMYVKSLQQTNLTFIQIFEFIGKIFLPLITFSFGLLIGIDNKLKPNGYETDSIIIDGLVIIIVLVGISVAYGIIENALRSLLKEFILKHESVIDQVYEERKEKSKNRLFAAQDQFQ